MFDHHWYIARLSHASTASDSATSNNRAPYAATRAFTVPADGFTVNLVCDMFSGTATLPDSSLTAIFVGQQIAPRGATGLRSVRPPRATGLAWDPGERRRAQRRCQPDDGLHTERYPLAVALVLPDVSHY